MPWHIEKRDTGYWVILDESGKPVHKEPHPNKAKAGRHLRALYANAHPVGKKELSGQLRQHILARLNQKSDFEGMLTMRMQAAFAQTAHKVFNQTDATQKESGGVAVSASMWNTLIDNADRAGLMVYKEKNTGKYRWITLSSNAYRDKDREIVSTKALQDDVDRADREGDYGVLRWWHVPGVDIGDCDFNMLHGRVLIESGTFRSERVAEKVKEQAHDLAVSIGFYHPVFEPDSEGVFHQIRRFERSLLPSGRASNALTKFFVQKGDDDMMATRKEKIQELRQRLGDDDLADSVLANADEVEDTAQKQALDFKETTDDESTSEKAAPPPKAEDEEKDMPEDEAADEETTVEEDAEDEEIDSEDDEIDSEDDDEDYDDEDEDDDEESETKERDEVGHMTLDEFAELVSDAMAVALDPYLQTVKELRQQNTDLQKMLTQRTKEVDEQRAAIEKRLKAVEKRIKELEGDLPSALQEGYRASQSEDTVVTDEQKIKEMQPADDPLTRFVADFINPQG